jgi:hypothetical protein
MFMREDLPTFERPINANSGLPSWGHFLKVVFDIKKDASSIFI